MILLWWALGCVDSQALWIEVSISGEMSTEGYDPEVPEDGPLGIIYGRVYHEESGEGQLSYPLHAIQDFELEELGEYELLVPVNLEEGEGLLIHAWQDLDEDGVLCGLDARSEEYSALAVAPLFPTVEWELDLRLDQPCAPPEQLYP